MGCNSCSNITLPGVAGTSGTQGSEGVRGIQGLTGPAGPSVSVIEIDTNAQNGNTSAYPASGSPNKRVVIPANTWEVEDDMVELEMMFQTNGKYTAGAGGPFMKVELGGSPVKVYCGNANNEVDFLSDLSIKGGQNQIVKMKVHLPMTALSGTGSIMPILETSVYGGTLAGTEYFSLAYDTTSPMSASYGRCDATTGVAVTGAVNLDVYMKNTYSGPITPSFNLIYYKLLSYKKIV